jgi:hypothetical protein
MAKFTDLQGTPSIMDASSFHPHDLLHQLVMITIDAYTHDLVVVVISDLM